MKELPISAKTCWSNRNNFAPLALLNALAVAVEELEDDLFDIEDLDKVDIDNEKKLNLIGT
jgi:hypothetical protein